MIIHHLLLSSRETHSDIAIQIYHHHCRHRFSYYDEYTVSVLRAWPDQINKHSPPGWEG